MNRVVLAVDPGHGHCGIAVFRDENCVWAGEKTPQELYDWLDVGAAQWARDTLQWDVMVVEEFRLYPKAAAAQTWSELGTVEVIGVIREYCRRRGIEFVLQPASIKRPTRSILRAHGESILGKGGHAKDAFLHAAYYLMSQKGYNEASRKDPAPQERPGS